MRGEAGFSCEKRKKKMLVDLILFLSGFLDANGENAAVTKILLPRLVLVILDPAWVLVLDLASICDEVTGSDWCGLVDDFVCYTSQKSF